MTAGLPGPTPSTPPANDLLRLVARQLFEQINQEHRRGLGFTALRQVEVVAIDPLTASASVVLGGDLDNPIPMVRPLASYVPRVGDVAWAYQNGSDLLLAGGPGLGLPKVEIRKGATSAIPDSDPNVYIDFGTTPTFYGGDRYGMYDAANSRIVFPWPGSYLLEYHGRWAEAAGGRRIAEIEDQDGNIRASDRTEWDLGETAPKDYTSNPMRVHRFTAGQWVKVKVFQSSGGPLSIQDDPASNVFAVTYQG